MNKTMMNAKTESRKNRFIPLAFALAAALFCMSVSPPAHADDDSGYRHAAGGYTGPGPALVTVEQAKNLRDDTPVALKGRIVRSLGNEDYLFEDGTGGITVEIDRKRWQGQHIGPDDLVEIHGEVDKEWSTVEIDVDRIIKQ